MAHYKIKISYDGTDFKGYQRQRNKRTIQGEIENALGKLGWIGGAITASGRTDTGVHADEQVATFELKWVHGDEELGRALNFYLPSDIAVIHINQAQNGFHPRYHAKYRQYRYQIYVSEIRNPLLERYHWRVWPEIDLKLVNEITKIFRGEHDFSVYGRPYTENGRTLRFIENAEWNFIKEKQIHFQIKANSFLYHMVRRITFILIKAGQQKVDVHSIQDSLEGIDNLPPGIAPAKGLFLEEILY